MVLFGYIVLTIGAIFVILSTLTIRQKGLNTLIDQGVYGIIRHPMYSGAFIMFSSHPLMIQHYFIIITTIIALVIMYFIIQLEDQKNIE